MVVSLSLRREEQVMPCEKLVEFGTTEPAQACRVPIVDKGRHAALATVYTHHVLRGTRIRLDVDLFKRNIEFAQKGLGHFAITAPRGGIHSDWVHDFLQHVLPVPSKRVSQVPGFLVLCSTSSSKEIGTRLGM